MNQKKKKKKLNPRQFFPTNMEDEEKQDDCAICMEEKR